LLSEEELSKRARVWLFSYDNNIVKSNDMLELDKSHPYVEEAQFNHLVEERSTIPNDSYFNQQWSLLNTGQNGGGVGADIDATLAWDITTGGKTVDGKDIVVAVIDNGFALTHPDLVFWENSLEIPNNGIDDDGNGYVDDYQGWNAYDGNGKVPAVQHGTHVSGIIGARGNNEIGVAGVNWGLKVMSIAGSSSRESVVVAAYGYALEMRSLYNETNGEKGAFIVSTNSSFGVNYGKEANYPIWAKMYEYMGEQGVLSAVSTMNQNSNVDDVGDMPSSCLSPYIISVTSTDRNDQKSASAAYGRNSIDLGAPGSMIYSTVLSNGYSQMSGTSMASPHVAGAIALMYAAAEQELLEMYEDNPSDLALIMKRVLLESVDLLPALDGKTVTGGRLNLYNSVINIRDFLETPDFPPAFHLTANETTEGILLEWEEYNEKTPEYYLFYRNGELIDSLMVADRNYLDITYERGSSYEYYVKLGYNNPEGVSKASNKALITSIPTPPKLVSPQNGALLYTNEVDLIWDFSNGAESYILQIAYDSTFTYLVSTPILTGLPTYRYKNLDGESDYYWRVKSLNNGGESEWTKPFYFTSMTVSADQNITPKTVITSVKVYPNPYVVDSTSRSSFLNISFDNNVETEMSIRVYNIKGQHLADVFNGRAQRGQQVFQWDGVTNQKNMGSGIYLIKIETLNYRKTEKVLYCR
jgi:subtilisin family serine protease